MSTHLNDVAAAVAVHTALAPNTYTAGASGPAVDLIAADGPCFAVQQVGALSDDVTWAGHLEESNNGSSWVPIADAEFAPVEASNDVQTITFRRARRYVRYVGTVTGTDPSVRASALIGQQKKTI